jgi:hypothetical protein
VVKKLLVLSVLTLAAFVGGVIHSTVEAAAPPTAGSSEVAKKGKKGKKGKGKKGKKGKGKRGKKSSTEAPASALSA